METAKLADEDPVSLNAASARNLRFLDREEEIIYPLIREGRPVGKSEHLAGYSPIATDARTIELLTCHNSFSAAC